MTKIERAEGGGGATCPMDFILRMLMGPWTTYILYNLKTFGPQRFGELKRRVVEVVTHVPLGEWFVVSAVRSNIGTMQTPPPVTVLWGVTKK